MACNKDNHPLYGCNTFIVLLPDKRMDVVRDIHLCINCLKSGHLAKQCLSSQVCKKCRGSHLSLLHKDSTTRSSRSRQSSQYSQTREDHKVVDTYMYVTIGPSTASVANDVSLIAVGPYGTSYQARALLDTDSSASFISEQVAQHLWLPRRCQDFKVSDIGGVLHRTNNVPSCSVAFDKDWKHLSN